MSHKPLCIQVPVSPEDWEKAEEVMRSIDRAPSVKNCSELIRSWARGGINDRVQPPPEVDPMGEVP